MLSVANVKMEKSNSRTLTEVKQHYLNQSQLDNSIFGVRSVEKRGTLQLSDT